MATEICAVPGGLMIHHNSFPGLTSWARFVTPFGLADQRTDVWLEDEALSRYRGPSTRGRKNGDPLAQDDNVVDKNNRRWRWVLIGAEASPKGETKLAQGVSPG